jgi:hypothetical protein
MPLFKKLLNSFAHYLDATPKCITLTCSFPEKLLDSLNVSTERKQPEHSLLKETNEV